MPVHAYANYIHIQVRTYYSTTVKNTAIHNDMETINVYSKWSDPVLLDPPLRSSTVLLSTTPGTMKTCI